MANTYSIKVGSLQTKINLNNKTNVIYKINFQVVATDKNNNTGEVNHFVCIDTSDLSNFIEFDNLTEQNILDWIIKHYNPLSMQSLQNDADVVLINKLQPSDQIVSPPWIKE